MEDLQAIRRREVNLVAVFVAAAGIVTFFALSGGQEKTPTDQGVAAGHQLSELVVRYNDGFQPSQEGTPLADMLRERGLQVQ